MKMTFRWFGEGFDPIPLGHIRQIPGMTGIMGVLDQYAAGDTVELTICRYYSENGTRLAQYEVFAANVELEIID